MNNKDYIKKINALSNNELVDKLGDKIKRQIAINALISILEVYNKSLELQLIYNKDIKLISDIDDKEKFIEKMYLNIQEKISNLDLIIESKLDESIGLEYFRNIRSDITNKLKCLNGYGIELSYSRDLTKELIITKKEPEILLVDLNIFYERVYDFLTKDLNNLYFRLRDILVVIPFRMTKEMFYDTLRYSLNKSLASKTKEFVENNLMKYREIFNPKLCINYGQCFDKYFVTSHKISKIDIKNTNTDELLDIYNNSNKNIKEINDVSNIILNMGIISNRFIVISMFNKYLKYYAKDFKFDIKEIKKIYNNGKKDKSIFEKFYNEELRKLTKDINYVNEEINILTTEYKSRGLNLETKLSKVINENKQVISYLNDSFMENEKVILQTEVNEVDKEYLDQSIESFLDFVDRSIKDMSNLQRKIRMKKILTLIDIPFRNPDDFFKFLRNSIENSKTAVAISIVNEVIKIIESYDA